MFFAKAYDAIECLCSNAIVLVTVATLTLVLFIASSYLAYKSSLNETTQSLKIDIENQTRAIAVSIEEYFRSKQDFVRLMADFLLVREYLDRVRQDTIETDPQFQELCSLLKTVSGPNKDIAIAWLASLRDEYSLSYDDISYEKDGWKTRERDWFPGTIESKDVYFSDPYMDFETGEVCVSLIRKVYAPPSGGQEQKPGEVVGVAGLDLFFPPIRDTMEVFVSGDVRYPVLISNDGSILYHPKKELVFKSQLGDLDPALGPFTEKITQTRIADTHLLALNQGKTPVYFSHVPVKGTTWSVGIVWQKRDAEKALLTFERALSRSLLLNLLLFLVPIVFFSFILINRRRRFMKMKRLYDAVMDQMQVGVAVINPKNDTFILTNPAYTHYLDMPPGKESSFSNYHSLLGVPEVSGIFQAASPHGGGQESNPTSETTEVQLQLNGTEHCFTHHFAGFRDYSGQKLVLSVLTDISELKKMQETLRIARDAAESASRAKSSFLANMSHEIRTPMNGIIGLTDMLATSRLDARQREYIDLVRSSAAALLTVINDILDHSKIEAGKLLIESYEFDLLGLLQELSFSFSLSAQQKSLEFQVVVSPEVPQFVRGDGNRLRQVLSNFLSNAIKFTTAGKVELRVARSDDSKKQNFVRLEVSDTGIGISESKITKLFTPFEQADSSTSRKFGGTGLGLTISKKLTELMGGDSGCRSEYGVGSVFWCELPLPESAGRQAASEQGEVKTEAMRILLVDDVRINLIVLSSMLQQWGHTIETATNGKQAIELLKKSRYDLVFMDCQMPEMDGYECTRQARLPETGLLDPKVPIIAVTAHAMTGDKERCLAAGMDDYISKPIDHGELQSKLAKWAPK